MRSARKKSKSGYYHVVIRGVNKQNIFYDNDDRKYFTKLFKIYGQKLKIRIHSYVLMDNHVHLLFDDYDDNISKFMQVLCSVYARYFNKKYDRIGHLFQNRFSSECIENNDYLIACCRYILQNPQKAGICAASDYKWSSYNSYKQNSTIICKNVLLSFFKSISDFYKFIETENSEEYLEIEMRPSEKQIYLIEKIKRLLGSKSPILNPEQKREELLQKIRILKENKISINNISRITGIGRYFVQLA